MLDAPFLLPLLHPFLPSRPSPSLSLLSSKRLLWSFSVLLCFHHHTTRRNGGCSSALALMRTDTITDDRPSNMGAASSSGLLATSSSSSSSSLLPTETRGIFFGAYHQPVHQRVEKMPLTNKANNNMGHVLVQVHAVGLNPVDAKGVIGDKLDTSWTRLRRWTHNLMVKDTRVGFDFAGVVVAGTARGNDNNDSIIAGNPYPPTTRVYGTMPPLTGSFSEFIRVPVHQIARAPSTWSMEEAAAMPLVGLTAWQALQPRILPGRRSNVLIVGGSGGTGHVAIQVARALGAKNVVTVCGTSNVVFCQDCGATHVVDYSTTPNVISALQEVVATSLAGQAFDVILDCVTSGDPNDAQHDYPNRIRQATSPSLVTPNHLYQRLGGQWSDWIRAGLARPAIFPHSWLWKDARERLFWIKFPHSAGALAELTKMAEAGHLKPRLQKVYPEMTADTVQQAMEDVLGRRVQGKVVLRVLSNDKATTSEPTDG